MNFRSGGGESHWMSVWVLGILAVIAACGTISPRRVVINNPSPSPTVSPTISPTPTITPTPTPTPTAMAAVVPSQFLFTADPAAGVILGFKVNRDGGLSPVPGSPFVTSDSPRLITGTRDTLFVAGASQLIAFGVNKETGTLAKLGSAPIASISSLRSDPQSGRAFAVIQTGALAVQLVSGRIQLSPVAEAPQTALLSGESVVDASGKFMYVLDSSRGTISAFPSEHGRTVGGALAAYPAGRGASSLTLVAP